MNDEQRKRIHQRLVEQIAQERKGSRRWNLLQHIRLCIALGKTPSDIHKMMRSLVKKKKPIRRKASDPSGAPRSK
jgi:hypothetical protein